MKTTATQPTDWTKIATKVFFILMVAIFALLFIGILTKIYIAHLVYDFIFSTALTTFGLDYIIAKCFALFFSVIVFLIGPWLIISATLGRNKKELVTIVIVTFFITITSLYYGTNNVFFDRQTGQPVQYYIKTLDGFKFSSTKDFDPQSGIKYKDITTQIIKEYYLWEKTGEFGIPQVEIGKYFDMITGEPIVWYAERKDGKIELFGLPGYDPLTGELLKSMTNEIAQNIKNDNIIIGDISTMNMDTKKINIKKNAESIGITLSKFINFIEDPPSNMTSTKRFSLVISRIICGLYFLFLVFLPVLLIANIINVRLWIKFTIYFFTMFTLPVLLYTLCGYENSVTIIKAHFLACLFSIMGLASDRGEIKN